MELEENKIYVISDISDNSINVVDIDNGNEIKVYISIDEGIDLNSNNNIIYKMDKFEFLKLNLTDNIIMKNNKLYSNTEKVEIKNDLAWRILADLYMEEEESEGMKYIVKEIKDNRIYLTNEDGTGGYFSIYKELYPNFEIGDIVLKEKKEYRKIGGKS